MSIISLIRNISFISFSMALISMIYLFFTNCIWRVENLTYNDGGLYLLGLIFNCFFIGISCTILYFPATYHFYCRVSNQNPKVFFIKYLPIVCFYWFFMILIVFVLIVNDLNNKETIGFFMSFTMASYLTAITTHFLFSKWITDVIKK